jgi:hypothetical protein
LTTNKKTKKGKQKMKNRHTPVAGYTGRPIKGRAPFIHKLQARKVPKLKALETAQTKFNVSEKAFNKIWSVEA